MHTITQSTRSIDGVPYRQLLDMYRAQIDRTRSREKRQELELICAILLDIITRQEKDDELFEMVSELFKRTAER